MYIPFRLNQHNKQNILISKLSQTLFASVNVDCVSCILRSLRKIKIVLGMLSMFGIDEVQLVFICTRNI